MFDIVRSLVRPIILDPSFGGAKHCDGNPRRFHGAVSGGGFTIVLDMELTVSVRAHSVCHSAPLVGLERS